MLRCGLEQVIHLFQVLRLADQLSSLFLVKRSEAALRQLQKLEVQ